MGSVVTGTKYCCMYAIKGKQEPRGENDPRGCFGWNLLEIVDDNAASCIYTAKKHTYKFFLTKKKQE